MGRSRRFGLWSAPAILFVAALASCDAARPAASGAGSGGGSSQGGGAAAVEPGATPIDLATCTRCHGDASRGSAAPPLSVKGATATSEPGVGAHQQHLAGLTTRAPLRCDECHLVPLRSGDPGHMDGPVAVVRFDAPNSTGLARAQGASPAWDRAAQTCSGVYCHGATLAAGGASTSPVWTRVDGSQKQCSSCHGFPPPAPHPSSTACATCHPATVTALGDIDVAAGKHIDGVVEFSGGACTACHGDATRTEAVALDQAAPPAGPRGELSSQDLAVGAHQAHLHDGAYRQALSCESCHVVPTDLSHVDGAGRVAFGGELGPRNAAGVWNPASATCSSTYCHGATLAAGGANTSPRWTGGASEAPCNGCHALPSSNPSHPRTPSDLTTCASCHPGTVDAAGNILVAGGKHIDGNVDVNGYHPLGWSSPDQHGAAANRGLAQCQPCHGTDLLGGSTGVSCDSCHTGGAAWRTSCTFCHGDASRAAAIAAAPPRGVAGETATTARGVGAHQSHLSDGPLAKAVACAECHAVPASALDARHVNGTREVVFGALARTGGAAPAYDAQGASCASTYCHGAFTNGGSATPTWTGSFTAGASSLTCTSCHGDPPGGTHPASTACSQCHTGYGDKPASGPQAVNLATHVNGTVDVVNLSCTSCHGNAARAAVAGADANVRAAPPVDAKGNSATTARGVGAHQAHVNGTRSKPVACAECHAGAVPTSPTHSNGTVQVAFGTLARTGGAAAAFSSAALTCASTYCHGAFTGGAGSAATPAWTAAGALACTSCHGDPPALPHPQDAACADCHGPGYSSTTVVAATHVDGTVNLLASRAGCTRCHGDGARSPLAGADANTPAAPPMGTRGETATTARAVGAHLSHLNQKTFRSAPIACGECHAIPAAGDESHANGTAAVAFGALARSAGAAPTWNGTSCASTYCHGAFANGAGATPAWTGAFTPGASSLGCTSCHGDPPGGTHPASSTCSGCHTGYGDKPASGPQAVNPATHLNGVVDAAALTCSSCHGDATRASVANADPLQTAAPPKDHLGNTAATSRGVGAHPAHVNRGALANPTSCATCHGAVPTSTSHSNGTVAMAFTGLAVTGGAAPAWNATSLSCASTYCHGQFKGGNGSGAAPAWTTPGQLGCGSCHGNPPPASVGHPQNASCGSCHAGYTSSSVNPVTHVNGRVDVVATTCTTCHGTAGRTGADPNVAAAPPLGTRGETATTDRAVGAHLRHLQDGPMRKAVACTECHAIPTQQVHGDGTVAMAFGALARTGGAAPAWNGATCASTYCHGATLAAGGTIQAPTWTKVDGTQAACGTCHGVPPPTSSGHPAVTGGATACVSCHPATVKADGTIDVAGGKHVDGTLEVVSQSCTSCHGDSTRTPAAIAPAPPAGTHGETATTARAVGAHQQHLAGTTVRAAIDCSECHTVPTSTNGHPSGAVDMTFGPLARTGGATPTWNGTSCASTYCHGATLAAGGAQTQPVWTTVDGTQRACTSCHGAPPPASSGHPSVGTALTGCAACHPATVKPDGTIDLAGGKHVNGTLEVVSQSCTSCHGDPARTPAAIAPAPPRDTAGLSSSNAVGAHLVHLQGGSTRGAMQCSDCHAVPGDASHASQPLDLTWGALARSTGVTPSWVAASLTCTNYCHGITLPGGSDNTPTWNQGPSASACGTCHGIPPPAASGHPAVSGGTASCSGCHPATVTSTGAIDVAGGKHVNGTVEVTGLSCTSCHGDAGRVAVGGADANVKAAPPLGTKGETSTSTRAVGAHQAHLNQIGGLANPVACSECHVVPSSTSHSDGSATVTFGALARTGGKVPVWNGTTCSASYCHGNFTNGNTTAAPAWTGGAMTCTSCHADPPSSGQHGRSNHVSRPCSVCHGAGYSSTAVNAALHVNGAKNVGGAGSSITSWNASTRSCQPTCHGSETW